MCMAGHITLDAAQDLRESQDYALEAPWDLSDFIQWPEKLQLNIKSSISMKKCGPLEIDKSLERPPQKFCGFSSVAQSCPTLCDPMDCSVPGLPVHHQVPELTQIHVHWVGDAIQPSHSLSSPSLSTFNLSQHQGLFQWVSSAHQVAKILELQPQHQYFQWIFRIDFL